MRFPGQACWPIAYSDVDTKRQYTYSTGKLVFSSHMLEFDKLHDVRK